MRAAIAGMTPVERRGTAYGVFNLAYGVSWFVGSVLVGWLYTRSMAGLAAFSVLVQLGAVPCLLWSARLPADNR